MGAGASLPTEIDKSTAQSLAGDKFDESAWEAAAKDGVCLLYTSPSPRDS